MIFLDVLCKGWYSSYDADQEKCTCNSGLTDTNYGCTGFANDHNDANEKIHAEIMRLFVALRDGGQWSTMTSASSRYWPKVTKYWTNMLEKTSKKANSACGRKSRGANSDYYEDIREIYDLLEEYKAEDDTVETLHKVIRLYDRWVKQTIFNCPRSGYGPVPSDWPTDDRGETCSRGNRLATFKCRIQFRFGEIYNSFSPSHGLNFN